MENIRQFFQQQKIIIFLFFIIVILLLIKVFLITKPPSIKPLPSPSPAEIEPTRLLPPSSYPTSQPISPSLEPLPKQEVPNETINSIPVQNISFTGSKPELPKALTVFSTGQPENIATYCSNIANAFSLSPVPIIKGVKGQVDIWTSNDISLTCDHLINQIIYTRPEQGGNNPTLGSAQQAANDFSMQINLPFKNYTLKKVDYFKSTSMSYAPSSESEANIINLNYQITVNSLPVYKTYTGVYPLSIFVGTNNQVIKFSLSPLFTKTQAKGNYPLIDLDQAVQLLNQKQGSLLEADYTTDNQSDFNQIPLQNISIAKASLNTVKLVYFYSSKDALLTPAYIFSGTGTASDGKTITLQLFISAVAY